MDPLEQMLIEKYQIDPASAKTYAAGIKAGKQFSGVDNTTLKEELSVEGADKAIAATKDIGANARAFADMHSRVRQGEALSDEENRWYQQVLALHRDKVRQGAKSAVEQAKFAAAKAGAASGATTEVGQAGMGGAIGGRTWPGMSPRPGSWWHEGDPGAVQVGPGQSLLDAQAELSARQKARGMYAPQPGPDIEMPPVPMGAPDPDTMYALLKQYELDQRKAAQGTK